MWDLKLTNLRKDIDIGGINKRISQMATERQLIEITEN